METPVNTSSLGPKKDHVRYVKYSNKYVLCDIFNMGSFTRKICTHLLVAFSKTCSQWFLIRFCWIFLFPFARPGEWDPDVLHSTTPARKELLIHVWFVTLIQINLRFTQQGTLPQMRSFYTHIFLWNGVHASVNSTRL